MTDLDYIILKAMCDKNFLIQMKSEKGPDVERNLLGWDKKCRAYPAACTDQPKSCIIGFSLKPIIFQLFVSYFISHFTESFLSSIDFTE